MASARSANGTSRLQAPVNEHPQRYLLLGPFTTDLRGARIAAVAGVGWASDKHDTMVQDADGRVLWEGTVAHDEAGIARLCARLCALGVARVAIERPDGLLVERLLDAGLVVLALHPKPGQGRQATLQRRGRQV